MTHHDTEAELLAALVDHQLIGNPRRLDEFFLPEEPAREQGWLARTFGKPAVDVPRTPVDHYVDDVSIDSVFLFDLPDEVTHAASAQTRWDAAVLAKSLVEDAEIVASVSPDMDAPDFETKVEVAVRARLMELFSRRG